MADSDLCSLMPCEHQAAIKNQGGVRKSKCAHDAQRSWRVLHASCTELTSSAITRTSTVSPLYCRVSVSFESPGDSVSVHGDGGCAGRS